MCHQAPVIIQPKTVANMSWGKKLCILWHVIIIIMYDWTIDIIIIISGGVAVA